MNPSPFSPPSPPPAHVQISSPGLPASPRGAVLAARVQEAFAIASSADGIPNDGIYALTGMSGKRYRRFINELIRRLDRPRYLEVGAWTGSTLCSAIHQNTVTAVAIDNWSQFGGPRDTFLANLEKFRTPEAKVDLIEADFRTVDYRAIGTFDVYFFDGPHGYEDHYDGLALAEKACADPFILIIDDWNWRRVRGGTLDALQHLGLTTICSIEIRTTLDESYPKLTGKESDWHNGYFIAVLERHA